MKRYLHTPLGNWKFHCRLLILWMIRQRTFWNHGFLWTLSGRLLVVYSKAKIKTNSHYSVFGHTSTSRYHANYFDLSSTKSRNDSGLFSFPMEWGDISSINPGWGFLTDLHITASLGQPADTSALGWNKLEFAKRQGYGFGMIPHRSFWCLYERRLPSIRG